MLGPFRCTEGEAGIDLAVELNVARRHLTDAQRVNLGREIEQSIAREAIRRQEELGRRHGTAPLVTDVTKGRTTDEVASKVGLGRTQVLHP